MRKYTRKFISLLLGMAICQTSAAYWYTNSIGFNAVTNTVIGQCEIHMIDGVDPFNYIGGPNTECFLKKDGALLGGTSEADFFDGDFMPPRGQVIDQEARLFPFFVPIVNEIEYCTHFESAILYGFVWSPGMNNVIKALGIVSQESVPSISTCDTHAPPPQRPQITCDSQSLGANHFQISRYIANNVPVSNVTFKRKVGQLWVPYAESSEVCIDAPGCSDFEIQAGNETGLSNLCYTHTSCDDGGEFEL